MQCRLLVATCFLGTIASFAGADEVEHPIYRSWANHKVGTSVTLRSLTQGDGQDVVTVSRQTLVALNDKEAVIETVVTSNATGTEQESQPTRYAYRRMFPLLPGVKKEDIGKPSNRIASGEEVITVAGKEYRAQWYDGKGQTEEGPSMSRTWMSDEVPGKLLKSINKVPAAKRTHTIELIEIKMPD